MRDNIKLFLFFISCLSGKLSFGQPVANFTASPVSGCAPLIVHFTDISTGNPTSWNWNLGNGTISGQKNPTTTYINGGIYTITLTVTNAGGSNTITKAQYITVYDKPSVKFTVNDSTNCVPFTTKFIDLSTALVGNINSWEWDFDDGSSSTLQNPQHLYDIPGNYNITLKVKSTGGCGNSLTKLAYIKAEDSIRSSFSFPQGMHCNPPEVIHFTNNTTGPGTLSFLWNFGDGGTSTSASPNHNYLTSGLFSVTMMVSNNSGCRDTLSFKDTLLIKNVQAQINGPDTTCKGVLTTFSNATVPPPLSSSWHFDDGTVLFGPAATKKWNSTGNYPLKLINNYSNCSDSMTKNIEVLDLPFANFKSDDSSSCTAPLTVNFTDQSPEAFSWIWNFGDGDISYVQSPSHTYSAEGEFDVKLTITDHHGCPGISRQYPFIHIGKPVVAIDTREGGGCIPYTFKPSPVITHFDSVATYFWDFGNGATSTDRFPEVIYTATGSYTLKLVVTSTTGCIDSVVMVDGVKTGTPLVVDFDVAPLTQCPGLNVQFTDLSVPADRWEWNFGDGTTSDLQNPQHVYSDSGKYSIKLIAFNNGCSDSLKKSRIITILPGLARFRPVYDCTNKKEVFFKDSSILPQTWLWDFGDGNTSTSPSPTHPFANYQDYTVSLTTTSGICTNKAIRVIRLINETPDFTVSTDSICKSDSTFFFLANVDKQNLMKYVWDYGDGTRDTTVLDSMSHLYNLPGIYTVKLTITDVHGCEENIVKPNLLHVFAPTAGFKIANGGGCLKQVVNFEDTSGNTGVHGNIAQWSWDFGDGQSQIFSAVPPSPVPHTYTATGSYYPSLKIIDSAGCSDSIVYSTPITIYQPAAIFFSPNYNTCINDSVLFRNPSTGNNLTFLWSFGDGTFSTDQVPVKKYSADGDYTVTLAIKDAYGCKDSAEKVNYIKVRKVDALFTVSDSIATCTPFQVKFTNGSINSLSQQWDFGDGGFSTALNPVYYYSIPGTYYPKLTAKRSNTCVSTYTKKIIITAPTATLTYSPLDGCAPLNVTFNVATPDKVTYLWDFDDGVSFFSADSNIAHSYTLPGSFLPKVVLEDSAGCSIPVIGIDSVRLYSSKVNFGVTDHVLCDSGTVVFSDSTISGSAVSGYRWDFGDGGSSISQNPSYLYNSPGVYSVSLFISTIFGCRDSIVKNDFIKVVKNPAISISGLTDFCGTSPVLLEGNLLSSDTSIIYWKWDFSNGSISTLQNPPAQQYNTAGSYPVQLIATNSSGCTDTANTQIFIKPVPGSFAGNDTAICLNTTPQLQASGADFYEWQPASLLSCLTCNNPVATLTNSTMLYLKGTNTVGCEKTDSVFITVKKPFRLTGLQAADSVCSGTSIGLNVSGAENYTWSPPAGLTNAATGNPVAKPTTSTTYKVVGSDSKNCFKDSATIFIKVNEKPSVNAGPDQMLTVGTSTTLTPQYSGNIKSWLWGPNYGLNCSGCPNPVATPDHDVTYTIQVTNDGGCTAKDEVLIKVSCTANSLFLPNAFTPNNDPDNRNEVFYPISPGTFKINVFRIYNRFGEIVFAKGNFFPNDKSAGWNGLYNGKPAPVGNYLYTIEFTCSNNETINVSGNILLLR